MQARHASEFLKFAALAAGLIAGASLAIAQQSAPAAPSSLQAYTTSDQTASVGVPAGWKVTKGAYGVIQMSGPNGEAISLGNGLFVKNGAFQLGQKANGLISMTMPNGATLAQKYAMVWQQAAAAGGDSTERVIVTSATPIPLGSVAQCGIFLGTQTNAKGPSNFESRFCSLPMDTNGIFKLFWMNANDSSLSGRSGARHSRSRTCQLQAVRSFAQAHSSTRDSTPAPARRGDNCRRRSYVEHNIRRTNG
jgi:hypothetical protein